MKVLTQSEFLNEGQRLFGDDIMKWKFQCPSCGIVISVEDYKNSGASENAVGFNCIGRYKNSTNSMLTGKQPCDYSSGGLICISPIKAMLPNGKSVMCFDYYRGHD